MSPQIKICGITASAQAEAAIELGADLIGLNFYPPSVRFVDRATAKEIVATVASRVPVVGVFVDEDPELVREIVDTVGLDLVQFHGNESIESIGELAPRSLKVVRVADDATTLPALREYQEFWGVLFDTSDPHVAGGTGRMWDHSLLADPARLHRRVFFAGGFTPANIATVLSRSKPFGVDACSGVESQPGIKDRELMKRFIEEIRDGEDRSAA